MSRHYYLSLFATLLIATTVFSQNPCCDYSSTGENPGQESETFGIGLGDIDGDGDLDAVVVDAYDDMEVYLNDSTGSFTYDETYGSDKSWFDAYLVDVDGDEDLDIVVSAFYSGEGCEVWKNDGTGTFTFFQGGIASGISMRQIAVEDLNGDSIPDIFAPAYSGGDSEVWFNDGDGNFSNSNQSLDGSSCTQAAIADFDGDGDPDAFISRTNGSANTVFLNNGLGYFSNTNQQLGSARSFGAAASDVDGDGDFDVVTANWQSDSQVWLNDGDGNFTAGYAIANDNYAKGIEISDIDYDCDDDVIIGSYGSNGLQVWTNDGAGNFSLCFENSNDIYAHGLAVGDLNEDLMPDVWVGNFSSSTGDYIFLKSTPVITYDTINLCEGDSVFVGCAWRSEEGDYLEGINCDTLCWYNVSITTINTSVTNNNTVLTAVEGYDAYQWLDCESMDPISGADSNVYDPEVTGSYAVEITELSCIDTSVCHFVQTPLAAFVADPTFGSPPLQVVFTDQSIDSVNSWFWEFGDGDTSNLQHPDHEYSDPGMYSVTLKITGPGGSDSLTKQNYIEVLYDPPTADFMGDPTSGTVPLEVQFTDLSVDSVNIWDWDFGDGATSTEQDPLHTYDTAGVYTVSLTVIGPGGSDEAIKEDYITVNPEAPQADFSGTPTSGDAPLMVEFTDLSTGETDAWKWHFGDGDSAMVQHPEHEYTDPGSYTVSLTASGAGGSDIETKEDYILVGSVGLNTEITERIIIYPNPASNILYIVFPDACERQLILQNMRGEVVLEKSTENPKEIIHLHHLSPGNYNLNIKCDGKTVGVFKVVKQ